MAEADLRAHQQRHPRKYMKGDKFLQKIEDDAKNINAQYDFTGEMQKVQQLVATIHDRMTEYETNKTETIANIVKTFDELKEALQTHAAFTNEEKDRLNDHLARILQKVICPLTEKGPGGPQEMCDATRYKLQLDSAEQLTRIGERVQKLQAIDMISRDNMKVWLGNLYSQLNLEFGTTMYGPEIDRKTIMTGIGEVMFRVGDAKRGV